MAEVRYSKYRIAVRRWSNVNVVLEAIGLAHINTLGLMGSVSRRTDLGFDSPHLCLMSEVGHGALPVVTRKCPSKLVNGDILVSNKRNCFGLKEVQSTRL